MKARVRQNRVVNPYRSVLKILKCVLFDRWHCQVTTPKVARPCCIRCHLDAARRWNQSYSAWTLARNRGRGGVPETEIIGFWHAVPRTLRKPCCAAPEFTNEGDSAGLLPGNPQARPTRGTTAKRKISFGIPDFSYTRLLRR